MTDKFHANHVKLTALFSKPKKWVEKPPVWIYKLLFLAL